MALMIIRGQATEDMSAEKSIAQHEANIVEARNLFQKKNHDYGEAWRELRIRSMTDLILMKLLRIKQIEDNAGATLVSEGIDANFCQFCLNTVNSTSAPPNMPNFELGALAGSPCDTLRFTPIVADEPLLIPNAFSPNEDGLNDTWHILNVGALQYSGYSIQAVGVYNRWGNEVFKSNDINFVWNGRGWASDSYYYYIRYRTKEGISKVQKGSINIVW